ncbi:hypothetical protein C7B65_01755 [Phormidesmis priestleyi ULC007]|uniref:Uncharacterized protein n=1 Tax=Phormidesmis priestleyi ULC007 TaxID=1920490 RepID=A0A2T1DNW9_9CYAN|nr:hypothetical protein [Phormidesmis priestleyi]PSB22155.1 hypothetical protein C7B65_01755 [Phormidesmis priestleyi ULC007]PZO52583.1 MAG: hypothetical protein DCF14_06440 [Phormidesmis priestleyi]
MPGDESYDSIRLRRIGAEFEQWPKLSCTEIGELTIATDPLSIPVNLKVTGAIKATSFQGDGSTLDGVVKKTGDTITGALTLQNNLIVDGNVGIGAAAPATKLEVNGAIKATSFQGDGSGLTNLSVAASQWLNGASSSISYGTGNVGIGTPTPQGKLDVSGDIRAGNSDLYFTKTDHNHTAIGNTVGWAAIENAADYEALMILGRAGTSKGRYVRLWDYLQVNGGLDITGNVGIGTTAPDRKLVVRGGETSLEQEDWQTPTLQNGWVNYDTTYNSAAYFKDSLGIVHLKGLVKAGTGTIFTLPVGYRPLNQELHAVATHPNEMGRIDILTNGQVYMQKGNNAWISLDGITFRAGARRFRIPIDRIPFPIDRAVVNPV